MNWKVNIKIASLFIISITAAYFIGKYTTPKNKQQTSGSNTQTAQIQLSTGTFTNPLLTCIEQKQLDMRELKTFKSEVISYIEQATKNYPDLHVSYYFRDLNNGIWIGINEKELFTPASLMKVPVLMAVLKEAEQKPEMLGTKIQYLKSNFVGVDEESGFPKVDGTYYTVEEYLQHMIVHSDNAATITLVKFLGMDKIVKVEKDLNLAPDKNATSNTNFVSVHRYAAVFRILYNAAYINKNMSEKALQLLTQTAYQDGIRAAVPAQFNVAHKYGERDIFDKHGNRTALQLHHFGIVYYTGKPYLIGVMTRGSDKAFKEKVIKDLATITFKAVEDQMKTVAKPLLTQ
ncbi:MAG: serine hydrolase [Bacteroidota bacterium]|jgi:beta-lactamase class A